MKKDKSVGVRINSDVETALKKKGWTVQKLLDWAVGQKVTVKTKIEVK